MGQDRTPLVEVPHTEPPFIVLENMVRDSQQHSSRGLHVVSLAEKTLKLGRGHESDVRIADVSISRCHATIRYANGQFLLEDNSSKFGTLVALKKPRILEANVPLSIQMGRTVLQMTATANPDCQTGSTALLHQLADSSVEDERALRLSLLTRGPRAFEEAAEGDAALHAMNRVNSLQTNMTVAECEDAAALAMRQAQQL
jgi:predicted component of type VI protein secretion system